MWTTAVLSAFFGAAVIVAMWELRRWALIWGATPTELGRAWPGDELSPQAVEISTRAITIDAPRENVWAWLIQIGQDRAGFYSYTWLENLFRCAMPRVDRIVPEWQERTLGDTVWLAGRDRYHGEARQKVVQIVRGHAMTLASPPIGAESFAGSPVIAGPGHSSSFQLHDGTDTPRRPFSRTGSADVFGPALLGGRLRTGPLHHGTQDDAAPQNAGGTHSRRQLRSPRNAWRAS